MNGFLNDLASEIYTAHRGELHRVLILLPSNRSGLFLRKAFGELLDEPALSPQIVSIDSFIQEWSQLELFDPIRLLFELYQSYSEIALPDEKESIEEFSKWGQMLLQDFNEIDRYLVEAKKLYDHLLDVRHIETWMPDGPQDPTPLMKKFLRFWEQMEPLYSNFRGRLLDKDAGYQGMVYRHLADDLTRAADQWPKHWPNNIYIAGFNALNKAEEVLFKWLANEKNAHLRWDADLYYLDNPIQEAGLFLRRFKDLEAFKEDGKLKWTSNHWASTPKKIDVWAVSKNMAQAEWAGKLLAERAEKDPTFSNTAVVLANEDLLLPVLNALPESVQHVNVTMGYPIKHGLVVDFLEQIMRVQEVVEKGRENGKSDRFYYKPIVRLISHPLWRLLYPSHPVDAVLKSIAKRNWVYFSPKNLKALWTELGGDWDDWCSQLLNGWDQSSMIDNLVQWSYLCRERMELLNAQKIEWEREFLFHLTRVLQQLSDLHEEYGGLDKMSAVRIFLRPLIQKQEVPFFGEPLKGLQIMGMLETRTLDFEYVIVLSVNEEVLPAGKGGNSFIPFDLKSEYKLPRTKEKDAIFAYHFYRLLQRSSHVHLLHTTQTDEFGSGERSRYITQIAHEINGVYQKVEYNEHIVSVSIADARTEVEWSVKKSEAILERLNEMCEKGFSPSALNRFLLAPLEFYFQYVLQLYEAEEVEETLEASTFGDVVHDALEQLYKPYVGSLIAPKLIDQFIAQANKAVEESWANKYPGGDFTRGSNALGIEAAKKYVLRFLKTEKAKLKRLEAAGTDLKLLGTEVELSSTLTLTNGKEVRIKGKVDRVHQIGDTVHVLDYKSGRNAEANLVWNDWESAMDNKNLEKIIQLMIYQWLWHRAEGTKIENIKSEISWLRSPENPSLLKFGDKKEVLTMEDFKEFEIGFIALIEKILNPNEPFKNEYEAPYLKYSKPTDD